MSMFTKKAVPDKKIDFLKQKNTDYLDNITETGKTTPKYRKTLFIIIFLIISVLAFGNRIIVSSTESSLNFTKGGILTQIKNIIIKNQSDIAGAKENRINIAALGIGGEDHDGPYLTDTIIIISIKPKDKIAALISVPRDLFIKSQEFGKIKINSVYALGELKKKGYGGQAIKKTLEDTFGINIHYYIRVDFNGFIDLIDALGGIDVYVERQFTDEKFPAENFKTKIVRFDQGWQHLDGKKSLQFARSRHGNNGEGSDFARAKRQQKILLAVKEKILKSNIILRPDKITKIAQILGNSLETDMEAWEAAKILNLLKEIDKNNIIQKVLDDSPQGELKPVKGANGSFLLVAKNKNELKNIALNIFDLYGVYKEKPRVVIQNGTTIPGLAEKTKATLERDGFTIIKIGNAKKQSYSKNVIFDLTYGSKQKSLEYLKYKIKGNISSFVPSDIWRDNQQADFIIILGEE